MGAGHMVILSEQTHFLEISSEFGNFSAFEALVGGFLF